MCGRVDQASTSFRDGEASSLSRCEEMGSSSGVDFAGHFGKLVVGVLFVGLQASFEFKTWFFLGCIRPPSKGASRLRKASDW